MPTPSASLCKVAALGSGQVQTLVARLVNDKLTSSVVYSFVFSSWFFVGLKWALHMQTHQCVWWAVGLGAAVAIAALLFLGMLTHESKKEDRLVNDDAVFLVVARSE
jgi:fatty acid desaturase